MTRSTETRLFARGDMAAIGELLDASLGAGFWDFDPVAPGSHRVAVSEGRVVGLVSACITATAPIDIDLAVPVCTIRLAAVEPAFRGRGVATRLLREVCVECERRGAKSFITFAWVHTTTGHAPLSGPLQHLGFVCQRRIDGLYSVRVGAPCPACGEDSCVCPADVYTRAAGVSGATIHFGSDGAGNGPAEMVAEVGKVQRAVSVQQMWADFLSARPDIVGPADTFTAWHFCDNQTDADELAALVVSGHKRATAGALRAYELEGEAVPQAGDFSVITYWDGQACCVIRTVEVEIVGFDSVSELFAAAEGEGDGSLVYWRQAHAAAFGRELAGTDYEVGPDTQVVCERFEVVFGV